MTRQECLRRSPIEGVVFEITAEHMRVYNNCTLFIDVRNCRRITLEDVRQQFAELRSIAKSTTKLTLKGTTKFMSAVRKLYPTYCAACDDIERLFAEATDLVRRIERDGLHMGCSDDEVLEAAIRKQNEIGKYYYRTSAYSRFLAYDKCIRHALMYQPWKDNGIAHYTLTIA